MVLVMTGRPPAVVPSPGPSENPHGGAGRFNPRLGETAGETARKGRPTRRGTAWRATRATPTQDPAKPLLKFSGLKSGESTTTRPSLLIFPASYLALAKFSISLRYSWKTSRLSAWPDP